MRAAVVSILAVIALAGCERESNVQPSTAGTLSYRVDEERARSVWLTRDGVQIHSAAARPVTVDLPGWTYVGEPHCPPGFAVGSKGEIVVTSNVIPTLWRIDPATLAVTVHPLALDTDRDKDVGFAAVVYAPEQRAFIAYSDEQRSVWKIDAALKTANRVAAVDLQRPAKGRPLACSEFARRLTQPNID
ncbi:MAG TPA: hypothetical protein VM140_05000 [Burkholderiales bacterium]|nr:hypothetical protein [Burkholderiales bacterium]